MAECIHKVLEMSLEKVGREKKPVQVVRCSQCRTAIAVMLNVDVEYHLELIEKKLGIKVD